MVQPTAPLTWQIAGQIRKAFETLFPGVEFRTPSVKRCDNSKFGDFQSEFALSVSKPLKKNPMETAQAIIEALPDKSIFTKIEAVKPGFINFSLTDTYLEKHAAALTEEFSQLPAGRFSGMKIVIDYAGPNIAKTLHVGHMRPIIIGDAICNLLKAAGAKLISDNHIGDWGTQFGKLIVAWRKWKDEVAYQANALAELERLYQYFEKEKTESLEAEARAQLVKLQQGDPENRRIWKEFVDCSLKEFDLIAARLGVHFDHTLGESFYQPMLKDVVDGLLSKNIAKEDQGAVIVDTETRYKIHGPVIVRKKDGAFNYTTTDLATIQYRMQEWSPQQIVYVTDSRQQDHFKSIFAIIDDWMGPNADKRHVYFGSIKGPDGKPFKTREGNTVALKPLMDEAVERARKVVEEKNPELPNDEKARIAEAVGIGALKYSELNHDLKTDTIFDWNRMLALEGNTAPYQLYTHARIKSVLRKYEAEVGPINSRAPIVIRDDSERNLIMLIDALPQQIENAAVDLKPNYLTEYLFKLSSEFNFYYNRKDAPVIKETDPKLRESRAALYALTAKSLKKALEILGITALERM